jgi:hypothetical protein
MPGHQHQVGRFAQARTGAVPLHQAGQVLDGVQARHGEQDGLVRRCQLARGLGVRAAPDHLEDTPVQVAQALFQVS